MPKIRRPTTRICESNGCERKPRYGFDGEIISRCSDHRDDGMFDQYNARCQEAGCVVQASFGYERKKPLYCKKHCTDDMLNVWNKTCAHDGCNKTVNFGYEDKKPTHCVEHRAGDMVDVSHKLCEIDGCSIRACWGLIDQKPFLCSKHGKNYPLARNVVTGRCEFPDCVKIPSFALPGEQRRFCKEHKTDEMSYAGQQCAASECLKQPSFGWEGSSVIYCKEHMISGMTDLKLQMCKDPNCFITASYGYHNIKEWCAHHGKLQDPPAKLLQSRHCEEPDCEISASFGLPGCARRFCQLHKMEGMINVIEKRAPCASCDMSYAMSGLDNMSLCCYCRPDEKTHRRKENTIAGLLKTDLPKLDFVRDSYTLQVLAKAQSRYRPDFWLALDTHIVIIEVDEQAHSGREPECEVARMINITMSCEGKPVTFIRYNPDGTKIPSKQKQKKLIEVVKEKITIVPYQILSIEYMFYPKVKIEQLQGLTDSYLRTYI